MCLKKLKRTQRPCYVDGSYHAGTGEFACGAVIFYQGEAFEISQKFNDPDLAAMRNVAGEIKGSEAAIAFCLEREIQSLEIHHDYEGIAKWCTGEWKANKEATKHTGSIILRLHKGCKSPL